jgi:DNA invertase Pin-like site-specific DNA recombinase
VALSARRANARVRVVLYHRVSTLEQDPELAQRELRAAAKARRYQVVEDLRETGSGASNDRPGLQRVLELARKHQVDAVMVWKLDRFGRSALDLLRNVETLDRAGVRFVALTQGISIGRDDENGAVGRLLLTMLAAVAEFERSLIVERTQLGLDKARRRGRIGGRPRLTTAPPPGQVLALREKGASWAELTKQLGGTVGALRRAHQRDQRQRQASDEMLDRVAQKGVPK